MAMQTAANVVCPTHEELYGWLNDTLSESRLDEVSTHVDSCDTCSERLSSIASESYSAIEPSLRLKELVDLAIDRAKNAGPTIGTYHVQSLIGRGGMGEVFLGESKVLGRQAAIKLVDPNRANSARLKNRFRGEIEALGRLKNDHIALAYEAGEFGDSLYLAMEYINGPNLEQVVEANGDHLDLGTVCEIGVQALAGLRYLHEEGVIHRDIKPANLILSTDGRIHLTDFGLAKVLDPHLSDQPGRMSIAGTPSYMSPEQCLGKDVSKASDIYGLGKTLMRLLLGEQCLESNSDGVDTSTLPSDVAELLESMIDLEPENRPTNFDQIKTVFERHRSSRHISSLASVVPLNDRIHPLADSSLAIGEKQIPASGTSLNSGSTSILPWLTGTLAVVGLCGVVFVAGAAIIGDFGRSQSTGSSRTVDTNAVASLSFKYPGVYSLIGTPPEYIAREGRDVGHIDDQLQQLILEADSVAAGIIAKTEANEYSFRVDMAQRPQVNGGGIFFGAQKGKWGEEEIWFVQTISVQPAREELGEADGESHNVIRGIAYYSRKTGRPLYSAKFASEGVDLKLGDAVEFRVVVSNGKLVEVRVKGTRLEKITSLDLDEKAKGYAPPEIENPGIGGMGCLTAHSAAVFSGATLEIVKQ